MSFGSAWFGGQYFGQGPVGVTIVVYVSPDLVTTTFILRSYVNPTQRTDVFTLQRTVIMDDMER